MSATSAPLRQIKSFVLRQGRMTAGQQSAFERLAPQYVLTTENLKTKLAKIKQPLILEIGFGMGDALLKYAKTQPDTLWLGIEVHTPGVGRVLNEMDKQHIQNIRIIQDDAVTILRDYIQDEQLTAIHLFFPDPWPKARHHKRRIVNTELINLAAQKLSAAGLFHMATDWDNYAEWMQEMMKNQSFFKLKDQDRNERPLTKFEQRGIKLGHTITDLRYEKI